jgi:hypothetical protein
MTVDDRLKNLIDCKNVVVVMFIEAPSPLNPLGVTRVVDIENLWTRQGLGVKTLDPTLKVVSNDLDDAGPFQRVLHMFTERHTSDDKGLDLVDEMRRSLVKVPLDDIVNSYSCKRSEPHMIDVCIPAIILD